MHEGWKVLSNETKITQRLLMRNGSHLSMSGGSPFDRGSIVDKVGLDREGTGVDEMLQSTFSTDREGLNSIAASSDMKSFIQALQIPTFVGKQIPTMKADTTVEGSYNFSEN